MKRKITTFIFGLLFLIGFAVLIYPTVSNQWNTYRQQQLISTYDKAVSKRSRRILMQHGKLPRVLIILSTIMIFLEMSSVPSQN